MVSPVQNNIDIAAQSAQAANRVRTKAAQPPVPTVIDQPVSKAKGTTLAGSSGSSNLRRGSLIDILA